MILVVMMTTVIEKNVKMMAMTTMISERLQASRCAMISGSDMNNTSTREGYQNRTTKLPTVQVFSPISIEVPWLTLTKCPTISVMLAE